MIEAFTTTRDLNILSKRVYDLLERYDNPRRNRSNDKRNRSKDNPIRNRSNDKAFHESLKIMDEFYDIMERLGIPFPDTTKIASFNMFGPPIAITKLRTYPSFRYHAQKALEEGKSSIACSGRIWDGDMWDGRIWDDSKQGRAMKYFLEDVLTWMEMIPIWYD